MRDGHYRSAVIVLFALACGTTTSTEPCREIEQFIECTYGAGVCDVALKQRTDRGFSCTFLETIRNAFGRELGERYVCKKCE